MRFRQSVVLAALGAMLLVATASPAVAGSIYNLQVVPGTTIELFEIDLFGDNNPTDYGISAATFILDDITEFGATLTSFSVTGVLGGATLVLNGPVALGVSGAPFPNNDYVMGFGLATLNVAGVPNSTIELLSATFANNGALLSFNFGGGGQGLGGPPDVWNLVFTAAYAGETSNTTPVPEPSGLLLFGVGLLLTGYSLRRHSK